MAESGEMIFLALTTVSLGSVLLAFTLGKYWLHTIVTILIVITTFVAGKIIVVFGFEASVATPIYAGIFLATDALHEFYGKKAAQVAVWKGFFAMILVTVIGQLANTPAPLATDPVGQGLNEVLLFIPGLFVGSATAYLISQNIDIRIFGYIKEKYPHSPLLLRNNVSTIISQLIDSTIVYLIAFSFMRDLVEIIMIAWLVKVFVAILDSPIIYIMKGYHDRKPEQNDIDNINVES